MTARTAKLSLYLLVTYNDDGSRTYRISTQSGLLESNTERAVLGQLLQGSPEITLAPDGPHADNAK